MKRVGSILGLLLILSVAGLVLYQVWPKYGLCLKSSRYGEIVCVARRNLHFSAHFTWSFNRNTVEAVMAEVDRDDIPVLAEMLGDERGVLRTLAGNILTRIGRRRIGQPETGRGVTGPHRSAHGRVRPDGL